MSKGETWMQDRCSICESDMDGGVYVAGVGLVCFECEKREFGPFDEEGDQDHD